VKVISLRGTPGAFLSDEFVDGVIAEARKLPDVGLVILDPLALAVFLEGNQTLNSQEGAATTLRAFSRIAKETGAAVLFAHHSNKAARREGFELDAGAATGSAQLVDLCRSAINLKALSNREADAYSLDTADGRRYVELKVSKSNGPPPKGGPFALEVIESGSSATVEFRQEARGEAIGNEDRIFDVIVERCRVTGEPVSCDDILAHRGSVSKRNAQAAWNRLVEHGAVIRHRNRKEQQADTFEPASDGETTMDQLHERASDGDDGDDGEDPGL
jgi:hypothetical protein